MIHSFNTDLAAEFGIEKAIILDNFCFWIAENERNERNFIDGRTWIYQTAKALNAKFHYIPQRSLANYLKELENDGILISAYHNDNPFDRTKWYALSDEYLYLLNDYKSKFEQKSEQSLNENSKSSVQKSDNAFAKSANEICKNGKSIKYNKQYDKFINSNSNEFEFRQNTKIANGDKNLSDFSPKSLNEKNKWIKPHLDEIKAYASEQNLSVDCEHFYDYFESVGWVIGGKTKMKSWQCALKNWARNERKFNQKPTQQSLSEKNKEVMEAWAEQMRQKEQLEQENNTEIENLGVIK